MIIILPPDLIAKLKYELGRAGTREIGGVLVGEHVGEAEFRVADLSVQRSGGSASCFVRTPEKQRRFMKRFFRRTGSAYEQFNYLGEWHSHPLFSPEPSAVDLTQMQRIVEDRDAASLFAVLLIVRLSGRQEMELGAMVFAAGAAPLPVGLRIQPRPDEDPSMPKPWPWPWRRPAWWPLK